MMVDDNNIALHRPAVHFRDEAFVPRAALLDDASVGARVDLMPERAGLGQFRQFGAVSGLRRLLPRGDGAIVLNLLQAAQHGLAGQVVELLAAQIVVAPLHVADIQAPLTVGKQRLLQKRNILVKELLLQVLSARRNNHALAGTNYGDKIRERLTRASTRLDDEMTFFFESLLDRLRHLKLPAAKFIRRMRA